MSYPTFLSPARRRAIPLLGILLATIVAWPGSAHAQAGEASWQFTPASAPPPPAGVAPASYPVPLGRVADIEFWAPNRGLLITRGNTAADVLPGLYAYNGVGWHQLSTVCGGKEGKIVWAGPDEFWTISDERSFNLAGSNEFVNLSLCHFLDGQVVGSYAEPANQPDSYQRMSAGACLSSTDCWFGGALGEPPNSGAFHLHWNGQSVTVVYGPQAHAIASMVLAGPGTLFESVQLAPGNNFAGEERDDPSLLHAIELPGSGALFSDVLMEDSACSGQLSCPTLPEYGTDQNGKPVSSITLGPLLMSSEYSLAAPENSAAQLWALAAPSGYPPENSSEGVAHPLVLRYSQGSWNQVVGSADPGGDEPFEADETPRHIAVEPGSSDAWVTVEPKVQDEEAHVDLLNAEGKIIQRDDLGTAQGVGKLGSAGPIACPAPHDCWLATSEGWLFHLTDGTTWPEDTDPNFAGVITFRPTDPSVPQLPPDQPPIDDSLANQVLAAPPPPPPAVEVPRINLPVTANLHEHLVGGDTLELTFKLLAKAHVQALASRGHTIIAKTHNEMLNVGKHTLKLQLNPRKWPNKIELKAKPLKPYTGPASSGGAGSVPAPISSNSVGT
jgi:hypothetical protein